MRWEAARLLSCAQAARAAASLEPMVRVTPWPAAVLAVSWEESSSQVTSTRLGRDSTARSDWLSCTHVLGITGYTVNLDTVWSVTSMQLSSKYTTERNLTSIPNR